MLARYYEAIKLIKSLGLNYDSIHAYANGCDARSIGLGLAFDGGEPIW
jgi:hypothetical protein